ncbi:KR domain-containing protein [Aspergillus alliaceus]|uniref:KR domain-containing protein n=1 Tax=Petromyces alliaceus TaxID=209559 RepID=A0A5N7C077_PETAA|nr:KR domain-containing protein [Aspergillus alliaceus]
MVLRDKPYELMSVDDFHTTLASKVTGTWNLHNVAMELGLTFGFFTIVSSMSGVIGQRGQANYAAANVFIDSFARYRQSLGLAANSIDLGAVAGVGYIAQQGRMEHHFDWNQRMKINERSLGEIVEASTLQQTSAMNPQTVSQLLTFISRSQPTQTCKEIQGSSYFEGLREFFTSNPDASLSVLIAHMLEILNEKLHKIMRLENPLNPLKALSTYGLDSLNAVELRNRMSLELGIGVTGSSYGLCEK